MVPRRAVITTPHALCESFAGILEHACDTVAVHAAQGLAHHLRAAGWQVVYIEGDTNRRKLDLNRKAAHTSPFHDRVDRVLRPGDALIDVHSFPGDAADPTMDAWGQNDVVLCAFDGVSTEVCGTMGACAAPWANGWGGNAEASQALAQTLNERGVDAAVQYPPDDWGQQRAPRPWEIPVREEALRHYYVVQRFGPKARPALMLEFDEDKGLSRLNYTLSVIGATIAQMFAPRPSLRR